jgi:thiol-disulfide isomerase/thioredoxin
MILPSPFQMAVQLASYPAELQRAGLARPLCGLLSGGRRHFIGAVLLLALLMPASLHAELPETQKQLVFITSDYCPFCQAWERQVGRLYDKTPYARQARLIRVDIDEIDRQLPDLAPKPRGTPTFVVFEKGREIGRFEGFVDAETFYWVLSEFVPLP